MKDEFDRSSNLDRIFNCEIPTDPSDDDILFDLEKLTQFAKEGDAEAQFSLAVVYDDGREQFDIAPDTEKALYWYKTAAESGLPEAMYTYGISLYHGNPIGGKKIPCQPYEGIAWLKKAAEYGVPLAQSFMGMIYFNGEYFPNDDRIAIEWIRMAVEGNDAQAQFFLGWAYSEGRGVPKDLKKSVEWLSRAVEQGHEEAQMLLASIQKNQEKK